MCGSLFFAACERGNFLEEKVNPESISSQSVEKEKDEFNNELIFMMENLPDGFDLEVTTSSYGVHTFRYVELDPSIPSGKIYCSGPLNVKFAKCVKDAFEDHN